MSKTNLWTLNARGTHHKSFFFFFFFFFLWFLFLGVTCYCLFGFNVAFNIFFSHITTVSGCDRELNAHFYSAASLKYNAPDTWYDTTPSHIILTLGQSVQSEEQLCVVSFLTTSVCRGAGSNPRPPVPRSLLSYRGRSRGNFISRNKNDVMPVEKSRNWALLGIPNKPWNVYLKNCMRFIFSVIWVLRFSSPEPKVHKVSL